MSLSNPIVLYFAVGGLLCVITVVRTAIAGELPRDPKRIAIYAIVAACYIALWLPSHLVAIGMSIADECKDRRS